VTTRPPEASRIIRVLLVTDHPAVRAGLHGLLWSQPDMVVAGEASEGSDLVSTVARCRPDVALVDYRIRGQDGLLVCHRLTSVGAVPRVVVYSTEAPSELALAARLAGAHGVVSRAAEVEELCGALRRVGRGGHALPAIAVAKLHELAESLPPDELPIVGMAINSVPAREIAEVLGRTEDDVRSRLGDMVRTLSGRTDEPRATPVGGARW
jgi:DNA-binding NarL/FixJ family response regulator